MNNPEQGRLLIEPLHTVEELRAEVPARDLEAVASYTAGRQREYLTWRALLYRELGGPVTVVYAPTGAPQVVGTCPQVHIAVSHGAGRVALCISPRPCAVDIERLDRHFERIVGHYLTDDERRLGEASCPHFLAVAWAAKETLYKLSGRSGLSLTRDLHLVSLGERWIEGTIAGGEPVRMSVRLLEDAVVVWYL